MGKCESRPAHNIPSSDRETRNFRFVLPYGPTPSKHPADLGVSRISESRLSPGSRMSNDDALATRRRCPRESTGNRRSFPHEPLTVPHANDDEALTLLAPLPRLCVLQSAL